MAWYTIEGRRNYFIEFGAGNPVLLLHGISNSGRAWAPQIAPLVEAGFRVIIPDHAGHGASARLDRPFGIADLARDTLALIDHLGLDKADLVGLSLGGMVAMEIALTTPARVRRLVVADSFDTTIGDAVRELAAGWAATFRSDGGPAARFEGAWPININAVFRASEDGLRTYQAWHGIAATSDGNSLAYVAEGFVGFDLSARLSALSQPALFIAGGEDHVSPPAISQRIASAVPGARYVEIRGAAHISNVDSAAAFNAAMIPFLNGAEPTNAE